MRPLPSAAPVGEEAAVEPVHALLRIKNEGSASAAATAAAASLLLTLLLLLLLPFLSLWLLLLLLLQPEHVHGPGAPVAGVELLVGGDEGLEGVHAHLGGVLEAVDVGPEAVGAPGGEGEGAGDNARRPLHFFYCQLPGFRL